MRPILFSTCFNLLDREIYYNFLLYNYFRILKKSLYNSKTYYNFEKRLKILLKYSKNYQSIVIRDRDIINVIAHCYDRTFSKNFKVVYVCVLHFLCFNYSPLALKRRYCRKWDFFSISKCVLTNLFLHLIWKMSVEIFWKSR